MEIMKMFVCNFKLTKKLVIPVIAAVVSVAVGVILFKSESNLKSTATCDEIGEYSVEAETVDEQEKFLQRLGFDIDTESRIDEKITIPSEFNQTYEEYVNVQTSVGMELEKCRGESAEKITYNLKNSDKYAVIIVCKGRVVGGHITNGEYGQENLPLI
jgi:hypothetical protein